MQAEQTNSAGRASDKPVAVSGTSLAAGQARPRVLISNATRLHAHHHAYALQRAGMLLRFVTSIWHKPKQWPYRLAGRLPGRLRHAARSFLAKRQHPDIRAELVEQRWALEVVRLAADVATLGRFRDLLLFLHKGAYDRAVARRVTAMKPDVVVGFEISCARTFAAAKRHDITTVLDLAGLHHDYTASIAAKLGAGQRSGWLSRQLRLRKQRELALADHIVTVSDLARQTLIANGVEPGRVSVVRLGVALQTFRAKEHYGTDRPFRILYVGNLSMAKGVDKLLEAFRRLALPDAELVLVGSHVERQFLERYKGLYTHIPYLAHAELADEYRRADIVVSPTLFDSWGMVVTEAMASGTPVIVTENCGAKELVSRACGWIVPAGDTPALTVALRSAHEDRAQLAAMGRHARAAVEALDWDNYHTAIAARIGEVWRGRQRADASIASGLIRSPNAS